jgi:hypothetical protein
VALGIRRLPQDRKQRHVALVYRETGDERGADQQHGGTEQEGAGAQEQQAPSWVLLHLGWHHQLHHVPWDGEYHWVPFEHIESEVVEVLVDLAVIIGTRPANRTIPYSVLFLPGPYFDEAGDYIERGVGQGLTCVTFILAVFRRGGMPLIDEATWPEGRRGDAPWVLRIVRNLYSWCKRNELNVPVVHFFEQIRLRWLLRRFRPEEICACPFVFRGTPPLPFETVNPLAISLLEQLP